VEADEVEKKKLEAEYRLKMRNAKDIKKQLHEFKLNYVKGMQEDMLEGELIKRQVEDDLEKERKKEMDRILGLKNLQKQQQLENDRQLEFVEGQKRQEELDEKKREEIAIKKRRQDNLRAAKQTSKKEAK